jgi:hypothetical protein
MKNYKVFYINDYTKKRGHVLVNTRAGKEMARSLALHALTVRWQSLGDFRTTMVKEIK